MKTTFRPPAFLPVSRFLSFGGVAVVVIRRNAASVVRGAAALVIALAATAANARTVSVFSVGETAAQLAFGDADGKEYKLAVCYGATDGGAATNTWDNYEVVGTVGAAETSHTVALPTGWGSTVSHLRYFLLSRPYAADLEFIGTGNKNTPAGVFFDSGVKAKDGTKMVAKLMVYSDSGNKEFCGAQKGSDVFRLYGVNGKTQRLGYCGSGASINGTSYPIDKTSRFEITTTLTAGSQSISCRKSTNNGSTWSSYGSRTDTQAGPVDWNLNLYILAINHDGTAEAEAAMKLYTLALYSDGDYTAPVRDFIPVQDESGVACLYDKVTGGLFYNQGSNTPAKGVATPKAYAVASSSATVAAPMPPVARYAYLQADGADDYIDLGVIASDGTKMVAEMEWTSTASGAPVFCGAATNASNGRFWLYARNSTTQRLGYLASGTTINGASYPVATGVRYRITTTLDDGAQSVACERRVDGAWTSHGSRSDSSAGPFNSILPLYLFADNVNGTAEAFAAARVYSLKLWQKDGNGDYRLLRHLVPAKTIDGTAALWDCVSETWFRNGGVGVLAHGAESPWPSGFVISVW